MNFQEMMEQLKLEYIQSLPAKIEEIRNNLKQCDVSVLREDFHKLKGTGKTYGLPEVSTLAEAVEKICLHKPQEANSAVHDALKLLKDIHSQRQASQFLDLLQDDRFHRIQSIAQLSA